MRVGSSFPTRDQSNPGPLHWERGVLPTGPPGKSQVSIFLTKNHNLIKLEVPIFYKLSRFEVFTISLDHEIITIEVLGKKREEQMKKEYFLFFLFFFFN